MARLLRSVQEPRHLLHRRLAVDPLLEAWSGIEVILHPVLARRTQPTVAGERELSLAVATSNYGVREDLHDVGSTLDFLVQPFDRIGPDLCRCVRRNAVNASTSCSVASINVAALGNDEPRVSTI